MRPRVSGNSTASRPWRSRPRKLSTAWPDRNSFRHSSNSRAGAASRSNGASAGIGAGAGFVDAETEFRRQPHRAQHAHRILAIALLRIADQPQHCVLHVVEAAGVVAHREILDGVIQRVGGEIAAHRVVLDRAEDVVAQQPAAFVQLAVAAAVIDVGAERGDLDDFAPEHDVREAEPAPDQAGIAEQRRTSSGVALVAMSKSFGWPPTSRSRTAPPTR